MSGSNIRALDGTFVAGYDSARRILDAARAGADVSEEMITLALMRTGDITRPTYGELAIAARMPAIARLYETAQIYETGHL